MPKNYCIMQIWAESGKSALPICNYSQILYQFLTFTQNLKRSHDLLTITVMEHSRFFCHMAIPIKLSRSITYFGTAEKVMPYHISPNGFAGGCFSAYAVLWRHKPFNLHYFRP